MSEEGKKAFEVKWRVENIMSWLQTRDDSLYSPQFLVETLSNTRWRLRLSLKWQLEEKYISLALERDLDGHSKPVVLNYELSFLASDGSSALKSESCTTKFALNIVSQEVKGKGAEILGERKDVYLPEGVLTVCCKLSTISKGRRCSMRSVIGKNCVTLNGTIAYFSRAEMDCEVTAYFMSPSSEICFLYFEIDKDRGNNYRFERVDVECKRLNFYSCKLYVFDANRQPIEIFNSTTLASLLISDKNCSFSVPYNPYFYNPFLKNDTLSLKLDITYYPGIESECIEYNESNYKILTAESADLNSVKLNSGDNNSRPLDNFHKSKPEHKRCEIEKNESSDGKDCFDAAGKKHLPSTTLKEDLTSLYEDRLFCDTKLRTDTETFPAHRNVLSARSPVFKKMFTTDMKEKAGECINVQDISSDTVRRMLQFLYTDCTGDLDMQSAKDIYIAADKYDIASLKQRCISFMKKNLCPANVCEVLVLADMHQDKGLESAAQEYVLTYDEEVLYSDEWKLFMKKYCCLAAQVMYLKCTKE